METRQACDRSEPARPGPTFEAVINASTATSLSPSPSTTFRLPRPPSTLASFGSEKRRGAGQDADASTVREADLPSSRPDPFAEPPPPPRTLAADPSHSEHSAHGACEPFSNTTPLCSSMLSLSTFFYSQLAPPPPLPPVSIPRRRPTTPREMLSVAAACVPPLHSTPANRRRIEVAPVLPATALSPVELCRLLESGEPLLVLDTRSMESFLGSGRLRYSINVSVPSLLCKRLSNRAGKSAESFQLSDFITTALGKRLYDARTTDGTVLVIDDQLHQSQGSTAPSPGRVVLAVLGSRPDVGAVRYLDRELGEAAKVEERLRRWVVSGENEDEAPTATPETQQAPVPPSAPLPTPIRPRSAASARAALCKLDTSSSLLAPHSRSGVSSAAPLSAGIPASMESPIKTIGPGDGEGATHTRKAPPSRLELGSLSTALPRGPPSRQLSFHEVCHLQAKSPPAQATRFNESELAIPPTAPYPPNDTGIPPTEDAVPPFEPSTIIPDFLYLGQEPTSDEDWAQLERLGVSEILNLAIECRPLENDRDDHQFVEKYWHLPMRDSIEETGVQSVLDKSCTILDDAKLRGRSVYVHCFLGRSRSCMVILAYLIHQYRWHLQRAYNYVAARREKISPNLGFMAELMAFEERLNSATPASQALSSLQRSKSATLPTTRSARLLLSSPISVTPPTGLDGSSGPRPTTKLERGTSDLGPLGTGSALGSKGTSRAAQSLLNAAEDSIGIGSDPAWTGKSSNETRSDAHNA